MKYMLIVGSRGYNNYPEMMQTLNNIIGDRTDIAIVSGGARGADALAKLYAKDKKFKYIEFPALWDVYGKSAGYKRNEQMHQFIAKYPEREVIAFWDGMSRGTQHNFGMCKQYNNPLIVIRYK